MVARLQIAEERGRYRRHAGGRAACSLRAFEQSHTLLEHRVRRAGIAAIDIAVDLALEARLGFLRALIDVAGIQEDCLGGLSEGRAKRAAVDEQAVGMKGSG